MSYRVTLIFTLNNTLNANVLHTWFRKRSCGWKHDHFKHLKHFKRVFKIKKKNYDRKPWNRLAIRRSAGYRVGRLSGTDRKGQKMSREKKWQGDKKIHRSKRVSHVRYAERGLQGQRLALFYFSANIRNNCDEVAGGRVRIKRKHYATSADCVLHVL